MAYRRQRFIIGLITLVIVGTIGLGVWYSIHRQSGFSPDPIGKAHLTAAIYRGGASCDGCSEAVAAMLQSDTKHTWTIRYVGEHESDKLTSTSLSGVDLYVQPGGGKVAEDWPKLTQTGQQAVKEYVEGGGHMLGICLGGFLLSSFDGDGWGWISGVDTYTGPLLANGRLAKTIWSGRTRYNYWEDGSYFGANDPQTTVIAHYDNGQPVAIIHKLPHGGTIAGVGTHIEADASWYNATELGDSDGYDGDLGRTLIEQLLKN